MTTVGTKESLVNFEQRVCDLWTTVERGNYREIFAAGMRTVTPQLETGNTYQYWTVDELPFDHSPREGTLANLEPLMYGLGTTLGGRSLSRILAGD